MLWFENGLPRIFEILGSTLFFIVLIVNSLFEPILITKIEIDRLDEKMGLLLNSVTYEDKNEEKAEVYWS